MNKCTRCSKFLGPRDVKATYDSKVMCENCNKFLKRRDKKLERLKWGLN